MFSKIASLWVLSLSDAIINGCFSRDFFLDSEQYRPFIRRASNESTQMSFTLGYLYNIRGEEGEFHPVCKKFLEALLPHLNVDLTEEALNAVGECPITLDFDENLDLLRQTLSGLSSAQTKLITWTYSNSCPFSSLLRLPKAG
mmetsp:Transcript_14808/g.27405  ORF Transcript_14808/g.27405 Transcript_14808/m.27405 type:complete len:143 (+) Transcript_14808:82-510(+)